MIRRDITGPTTDMTIAIGSWRDQSDTARVMVAVHQAAYAISIDRHAFAGMVHKLLLVGRPEKAQKLVDALGTSELHPLFVLGVRTLLWFMPAAIIGAIVWLVLR